MKWYTNKGWLFSAKCPGGRMRAKALLSSPFATFSASSNTTPHAPRQASGDVCEFHTKSISTPFPPHESAASWEDNSSARYWSRPENAFTYLALKCNSSRLHANFLAWFLLNKVRICDSCQNFETYLWTLSSSFVWTSLPNDTCNNS